MKRLAWFPPDWWIRNILEKGEALAVFPVKPQPIITQYQGYDMVIDDGVLIAPDLYFSAHDPCDSGDRVWVPEIFFQAPLLNRGEVQYGATYTGKRDFGIPWKSPATMPFRHSRLHLEIVSVGCKMAKDLVWVDVLKTGFYGGKAGFKSGLKEFFDHWTSRYGSWDQWVWMLGCKRTNKEI